MRSDLSKQLAALGTETDRLPVTGSADLRGRADRRARVRAVSAIGAVAAVTAAVLTWSAAAPTAHGPLPPGTAPSATPVSASPAAPEPAQPSIPDAAMLQVSDLPAGGTVGPPMTPRKPYTSYRPCTTRGRSNDLPEKAVRAVSASFPIGLPEGPRLIATQVVTLHRPGGAEQYMDDVRYAIPRCSSTDPAAPVRTTYEVVAEQFSREDSIIIRITHTSPVALGFPEIQTRVTYVAIFRSGDHVAVVEVSGFQMDEVPMNSVYQFSGPVSHRLPK
ncbi:hypothetical protein [Longispora albida]|uniref:hypothetical protein n=1 Tax=Longispora albida TaxID=203523 RepID=UPI00047757F1|nr:hypothetical protein [Longispora albida]